MRRKKGFYSISVVAKMFSVHQQTVRMYEKEGLISPKRTEGNTRLFSEEDVDRLEEIINLTHNMGVNLAGVQIILKLQKKIKKLQTDMNKTFERMQENLEQEGQEYEKSAKKQGERLLKIKKENQEYLSAKGEAIDIGDSVDTGQEKGDIQDDWEVDYED